MSEPTGRGAASTVTCARRLFLADWVTLAVLGAIREVPVVMAAAWDRTAVAGAHFLASHADRERVIDALRAAFAEGRLARDEFDARVARTSGSRTYAELAAVTADIPAWPVGAGLAVGPARAPDPRPAHIEAALLGVAVSAGIPPAMLVLAFIAGSEKVAAWAVVLFLIEFVAVCVAGTVALGRVIDAWLTKCRSSRPAPPPGYRGRPPLDAGPQALARNWTGFIQPLR